MPQIQAAEGHQRDGEYRRQQQECRLQP